MTSAHGVDYEMLKSLEFREFLLWNMIHIRAIGDVSESETEYGKFEMATSDRDDFCSMYLLIASRSRVDIPFFICPFQGFMWPDMSESLSRLFVSCFINCLSIMSSAMSLATRLQCFICITTAFVRRTSTWILNVMTCSRTPLWKRFRR